MKMEINPAEYKILVVDDVISNVLLLRVLLNNEKFNVVTAENGVDALEKVYTEKPDLILLDVMMPDISGFEVASRLKEDPKTTDIPIIFLTALNDTADIVKGFQNGGNDFISKPFNKEELIIRVTHQISLIAAQRIILKQTEELKKTISARDQLYSVIAHDMRAPLGSVKMILNMLLLTCPEEVVGEELHNLMMSANRTTEDVFMLLDNLLKWTKGQVGNIKAQLQDFELSGVVESVVKAYNIVASVKKVNLLYDCNEKIEVEADIEMVKTILKNLLSNAIKYSNAGSDVVIMLTKEETNAVIKVVDKGCGIADDDKSKIFNPEIHHTTFGTANEEGAGLGLLLCQDLVKRMNGNISFTSVKGEGSEFSFTLPLFTEK